MMGECCCSNPRIQVIMPSTQESGDAVKVNFLRRELLDYGYIDPADLTLFSIVHAVDDALGHIDHFYRRYHSLRYVGDRLVVRLLEPLDDMRIDQLQQEFSDLLLPQGCISRSGPLPEEANETQLQALPRLIIDFNRRDFARLRHLIDAINA